MLSWRRAAYSSRVRKLYSSNPGGAARRRPGSRCGSRCATATAGAASLDSPSELRTIVEVGAVLPLDAGSADR